VPVASLSVNSPQTSSLLGKLTGLRIQSLLYTEAKPEFQQDEPALEVNMTRKGGEVLSYRFSKPADPSYYALKRSDRDHYFKVAEYSVTPVKEITREKLVQARTGEASSGVSSPGEFHPKALAEPYVNVSAHTAPIIRP